jgi:hypothetical protein
LLGIRHRKAHPISFIMKGRANLIREFIAKVDWVTPENISFLLYGENNANLRNDADFVLGRMTTAKKLEKRLKMLGNDYEKIYALADNPKHAKGNRNLKHDVKLRNVLAVMKPEKCQCNKIGADADIEINGDKFFLEFDNGHEDEAFLRNKLLTHYGGEGKFRVIFIMASRDGEKEQTRFDKLFKIVESSLKNKKGRVLGAMYSQYLIDRKLYNWRGECVINLVGGFMCSV